MTGGGVGAMYQRVASVPLPPENHLSTRPAAYSSEGRLQEGSAQHMSSLMTRIRPLTTMQRVHPRRQAKRPSDLQSLRPGADERLVTGLELDQLRRLLPGRVI